MTVIRDCHYPYLPLTRNINSIQVDLWVASVASLVLSVRLRSLLIEAE